MYKEGNILYFTPFYFKNGNTPKPKYFVVLKVVEGKTILASLPTRKDHIPVKDVVKSGCVELPDINLNCFVFAPNETVTCCGKCFDFPTHIYGSQLDFYEIETMNDLYRIEGVDFELFGEMQPAIFRKLVLCLKNSKAVKKKFIRIL